MYCISDLFLSLFIYLFILFALSVFISTVFII